MKAALKREWKKHNMTKVWTNSGSGAVDVFSMVFGKFLMWKYIEWVWYIQYAILGKQILIPTSSNIGHPMYR